MLIQTFFFVAIRNIELPKPFNKGDPFWGRFYLTGDRSYIGSIAESVKSGIGSVEADYLADACQAIVYSQNRTELNTELPITEELNRIILDELYIVQAFLFVLWMIKDHALVQDNGWLTASINGKTLIHCNSISLIKTMAGGGVQKTKFNFSDIKLSKEMMNKYFEIYQKGDDPTLLNIDTTRHQRFLYFVDAARSISDLAMKVSLYCSALEALVSSSTAEVTHQVAERTACLLEPLGDGRFSRFKRLKDAYNIRSKAVHGAAFRTKDFEKLKSTSIYLDDTCRKLATLYLRKNKSISDVFIDNEDALSEYFGQLLLCNKAGWYDEPDSKSR